MYNKKTLGQMIIDFDNKVKTNVKLFNETFYLSDPIKGFDDEANVEIGEIVTAFTRIVNVDGIPLRHDFRPLSSEKKKTNDELEEIDNE